MSHLEKNLATLRIVAPAIAASVELLPASADYQPATGTDGTPTYCRTRTAADGRKQLEWLGATSMPQASAAPLVSTLDPGVSNGLGLSIGTGFEWIAFLKRLSTAQALFVYEPGAELRLALEICDLSDPLLARRLVLLCGPPKDAAAALARWLTDHPGVEPPTVLHPLPTLGTSERRNLLLAAGEQIVRHGVHHREAQLADLVRQLTGALEQTPPYARPAHPIAMTGKAQYPLERPLHPLAAQAGIPVLHLADHESASVAARLAFLGESLRTGPVRVLSDWFRPQLSCIPPQIAVETWIPPLMGALFWEHLPSLSSLALSDRIVVHSQVHRMRLLEKGAAAEQIELRPLPPLVGPVPAAPAPLPRKTRIALVADLPRTSPEALGLVLPTHVAVDAAARALIADDFLTVHAGSAPDLLRRALDRAQIDGAAREDPTLRDPMLRLIRDMLIPAIPLLTLVRTLVTEGFPLTLIGDWPDLDLPAALGSPSASSPDSGHVQRFSFHETDPWRDVAGLFHFMPEGTVSPLLWDAVGKGIAIFSPEHPSDPQPGSLATLLAPDRDYCRPRRSQWLTALRNFLRDYEFRGRLQASALLRLDQAFAQRAPI
jgi:hypothetical protein